MITLHNKLKAVQHDILNHLTQLEKSACFLQRKSFWRDYRDYLLLTKQNKSSEEQGLIMNINNQKRLKNKFSQSRKKWFVQPRRGITPDQEWSLVSEEKGELVSCNQLVRSYRRALSQYRHEFKMV